MKSNLKLLSIFLVVILLVMLFSACKDDTGVTIYGSIDSLETSDIKIEVNTDAKAESESDSETEVETSANIAPQTEIVTEQENDEITESVTDQPETEQEKEQSTETIPNETTSAPETEKETEAETTQKVENENQTEYLLNTNTKKFHYLSCKSGQRTKDANRANYNGSRDEIIAKGYSPCKVCNP